MLDCTRPAIEQYHRLVEANLESASAQVEELLFKQHERGVLFGGRPLAGSLRPVIMSESMYNTIQDTVYILRQAILKLSKAFFNERSTLDELGLTEEEIELAAIPTNIIRMSATARMDAFMTNRSFKFVELNAESPAGIAYVHELAKIYRELPIFREFEKTVPIRFVSPLVHIVAGLLRIYYEEFDGKEEMPAFAIVDHLDVPTYQEFVLFKNYMERQGYVCEISDPRDLEVRDGWIYANGRKIDILYRRLLMNEYMEMKDECGAYTEGYIAQKTCYLNSFRSKLVHKKALFSLLTDPVYSYILDIPELHAIQRHIPWTRRLRDQRTTYNGKSVDVIPMIRASRDRFVIKPNDEYGGSGVTLGFEADQGTWDAAISEGLQKGHVVQEVVEISREPFLVQKQDRTWDYNSTVIDLDPYLNGPLMGGCLTRTSTSNLANVTAGGGTLPLFIARYL
ncbi:MAG: hypothetical protein ACNA8K_11385 [Cyclonatronaceae bacterium]